MTPPDRAYEPPRPAFADLWDRPRPEPHGMIKIATSRTKCRRSATPQNVASADADFRQLRRGLTPTRARSGVGVRPLRDGHAAPWARSSCGSDGRFAGLSGAAHSKNTGQGYENRPSLSTPAAAPDRTDAGLATVHPRETPRPLRLARPTQSGDDPCDGGCPIARRDLAGARRGP